MTLVAASKRRLKADMGFFSKAPPPEPEPRPKMSINPTAVATVLAVIAVPIVVVGLIGLLILYCCCCKGDLKQPTPTAEVEMPAAQPTESHV